MCVMLLQVMIPAGWMVRSTLAGLSRAHEVWNVDWKLENAITINWHMQAVQAGRIHNIEKWSLNLPFWQISTMSTKITCSDLIPPTLSLIW